MPLNVCKVRLTAIDFVRTFQKILSDSATRTKFASHTEQGKELAAYFRQLMEATYEAALEEKWVSVGYIYTWPDIL